jgi:hypothetical protein
MAKAKLLSLEELHNLTAQQLTDIIRKGVPLITKDGDPVTDPSTGEVMRAPASAAYFATAIKFLKDNDITAELSPESPLAGLVSSLPTFEEDEGDLPARPH